MTWIGLMVDTETIWVSSARKVFSQLGVPFPEDLGESLIGLNNKDCKRIFEKRFKDIINYVKYDYFLKQEFRNNIEQNEISIKEGLFEVLEFLESRNIRKTVATSSSMDIARTLLSRTRLNEHFDIDRIMTGDQITNGKPHPEIFKKAAERIGVSPYNCIAFEDSNPGVQSAVAARHESNNGS